VGGRRWSLTPSVLKSKKGEGSQWGTELVRGKRRRLGGTLVRLHLSVGGQLSVAHGVAARSEGAAVARVS
jgi:hypothetical protein